MTARVAENGSSSMHVMVHFLRRASSEIHIIERARDVTVGRVRGIDPPEGSSALRPLLLADGCVAAADNCWPLPTALD